MFPVAGIQAERQDMTDTRIVQFPENTVIIREGEVNDSIYKIIKGHAEVYVGFGTDNETLISIIGKQACFGEFGLLLNEPSICTVRAYSELYALRITEEDMGTFVMENNGNVIGIMRNMAKTMMVMRRQIEMLIMEIESGKKPDEKKLADARRAMRAYGMYRSIQEASAAITPHH